MESSPKRIKLMPTTSSQSDSGGHGDQSPSEVKPCPTSPPGDNEMDPDPNQMDVSSDACNPTTPVIPPRKFSRQERRREQEKKRLKGNKKKKNKREKKRKQHKGKCECMNVLKMKGKGEGWGGECNGISLSNQIPTPSFSTWTILHFNFHRTSRNHICTHTHH